MTQPTAYPLAWPDGCPSCEGCGWTCRAHPSGMGPYFEPCEGCGNPRGLPPP